MAQITGDWLPAVRAEFAKPYYRELYTFLQKEYRNGTVYPPADQIFNALHLTPLNKVKVVILTDQYLQGTARRCRLQNAADRVPDQMGAAGSPASQHGADRQGSSGEFPQGARLGAVHGRDHTGGGAAGQADRLYALGFTGSDQIRNGDKSQTSGT